MAETTHTPGPWFVAKNGYHAVRDDEARDVVTADGITIAEVREFGGVAEREANADLIATAPELYEQLEYWLEYVSIDPKFAGWVGKTRAVLAKARGEAAQ
jgi:hypothetical protein